MTGNNCVLSDNGIALIAHSLIKMLLRKMMATGSTACKSHDLCMV